MEIRLNKFLSQCGVVSRRKADQLIESGEITVNGKRVFELGVKINPDSDVVKVEGKVVKPTTQGFKYILFHKPKGVITSLEDPLKRPCVGDYFASYSTRVFPVGRLDFDSEGLLILTNDGDFANKVSHPKNKVTKKYYVKINGKATNYHIQKLKNGVSIPEGGRVSAKSLLRLSGKSTAKHDWLIIEITEGKNRQIRKMFEKIGFDVLKLQRFSIGGLEIGSLKRGSFRELSTKDIEKIFKQKKQAPKKQISKKIVHG